MTPLNPFFRQAVASEQRLVQDLVNEHLRMYGQEVYYMPRKYMGTDRIMRENILARFDDAYPIEAYIANVDGFQGSGDLMTKFGIRVTDEATFIISKERFQDYIGELASNIDSAEDRRLDSSFGRPMEGDLIYFPLTDSLFEIKFVEHESPFYQFGQLTTFELRCELFEYEQEVIDTGIGDIDDNAADIGYVVTLNLVGAGLTATANFSPVNGGVHEIIIQNDGYGYESVPIVSISTSPNGAVLGNATAVAIGTIGAGSTTYSLQSIKITNPGFGYTTAPTVTILGSGSGAKARANIGDGVLNLNTFFEGTKYSKAPVVAVSTSPSGLSTSNAVIEAVVSSAGTVSQIRYTNAGFGYTVVTTAAISSPYETLAAQGKVGIVTAAESYDAFSIGIGTTSETRNVVTGVVTSITVTQSGVGYTEAPTITISDPTGFKAGIVTAGIATVGVASTVSSLSVSSPGENYGTNPAVTIANPSGFRSGIITAGVGIGTTINSISIGNSGAYYYSAPILTISDPAGVGSTATATAFINSTGIITGVTLTSPGFGYSITDTITVTLTGGISTATGTVQINSIGIITSTTITNAGFGYTTIPSVTLTGGISTATATAFISSAGIVTGTTITNAGAGYTTIPTITFDEPGVPVNSGDYLLNEIITGQSGLATALVKEWNASTNVLKVYNVAGNLAIGEVIAGSATTTSTGDLDHVTANYILNSISYEHDESTGVDAFESNTEIQDAATDVDGIVDWTETNPFGTF